MNHSSQTHEDKNNCISLFFINQVILTLGLSCLVTLWASWHVWGMGLYLKTSQNPTVQTSHSSQGTYGFLGPLPRRCTQPPVLPWHSHTSLFSLYPTSVQWNFFLVVVGGGLSLSHSCFFPSCSPSPWMLLCFFSFTSPKRLWFLKGSSLGNKEPKHFLGSVLQHSSHEAKMGRKVCALQDRKRKKPNMGITKPKIHLK